MYLYHIYIDPILAACGVISFTLCNVSLIVHSLQHHLNPSSSHSVNIEGHDRRYKCSRVIYPRLLPLTRILPKRNEAFVPRTRRFRALGSRPGSASRPVLAAIATAAVYEGRIGSDPSEESTPLICKRLHGICTCGMDPSEAWHMRIQLCLKLSPTLAERDEGKI